MQWAGHMNLHAWGTEVRCLYHILHPQHYGGGSQIKPSGLVGPDILGGVSQAT